MSTVYIRASSRESTYAHCDITDFIVEVKRKFSCSHFREKVIIKEQIFTKAFVFTKVFANICVRKKQMRAAAWKNGKSFVNFAIFAKMNMFVRFFAEMLKYSSKSIFFAKISIFAKMEKAFSFQLYFSWRCRSKYLSTALQPIFVSTIVGNRRTYEYLYLIYTWKIFL